MRQIQSLARGLQILDLFVNTRRSYSVTEVAQILDIDKSSASRLLGTMEHYGYITQATDTRGYSLGKRMLTIGWQLTHSYALSETARPYLDALAHTTGEAAHIGVYTMGKALITDDIQPQTSILQVVGGAGRTITLHNTAIGKALIALGDFPLPDSLPQLTPRTLTTYDALEQNLAKVRQSGCAIDDEENEPGVRCLAAPVFDSIGIVIAAVGISGPTVRITDARLDGLVQMVKDTAQRLSQELDYDGEYPPKR